jgi:shikimate dehydrogenase
VNQRWAYLLGNPVGHSVSPAMHNAAFQTLGIDATYDARLVAPEALEAEVSRLRDADCLGANVTIPYKQAVVPLLDHVDDESALLGAVNTIVRESDGSLSGTDTDALGLERWMRQLGISDAVAGRDTLVLGAGGAARATVLALVRCGARAVRVHNRSPARLKALVDDLGPRVSPVRLDCGALEVAASPAASPVGVLVNATSLGLLDRAPTVDPSWYGSGSWAIDLVYNPPETPFMRNAHAAGANAENGLGMLVHQAALAFERWTGQAPPMAAMEAAAVAALRTGAPETRALTSDPASGASL